jgi:AcrR family transcriptional regulator
MEYSGKALDILETAKKLFSQKGFKAVTTREIAEKAKVNEVTIFRHFKNKENLFDSVITYSVSKPNIKHFIDPNEPVFEKYLLGIAKLLQSIFTDNLEIFKIELFEFQMSNNRQHIKKMPNMVKDKFVEYLINNQKMNKEKAEIFAVSYMLSVHGLCMNIYFLKIFNPAPNFDDCLAFIIDKFKN